MWPSLLSLLTFTLLAPNVPVPDASPPACFQDGEVRFGANCDAFQMVMRCIEAVVGGRAVETQGIPLDTPIFRVYLPEPEPPSLSSCAMGLP